MRRRDGHGQCDWIIGDAAPLTALLIQCHISFSSLPVMPNPLNRVRRYAVFKQHFIAPGCHGRRQGRQCAQPLRDCLVGTHQTIFEHLPGGQQDPRLHRFS
jgi:hypothetical protein